MPFPFPGDLPNPGIEPGSPALQGDSLPSEPSRKPYTIIVCYFNSFSYRTCVCVCVCVCEVASVRLFATLGTVSHQASLSVGFSRQGSLPLPPPGKPQRQSTHMLTFQGGLPWWSDGKEPPRAPTPSTPTPPPAVREIRVQSLGWWKVVLILQLGLPRWC